MNASFSRRGACPALSAPMQTGDGLLVRLRPMTGGISPKTLIGLCEAAARHGNGVVEVTARGSLQIRGLTASSAPLLAGDVDLLGIAVRTGVPVETGPLAGLDPEQIADPTPLAESVRTAIERAGLEKRLGPKVSVLVDGGGHSGLDGVAADVRLGAVRLDGATVWQLALAGDAKSAEQAAVLVREAACDAALQVLTAIAALGIDARARDLRAEWAQTWRSALPPSVLPDISPTRVEIGRHAGFRRPPMSQKGVRTPELPISPLVGEMSGRTEGGAKKRKHLINVISLVDGRYSLGVALPFGHVDAARLIAFAKQAEEHAVTEIRLAPKRTLLALCPSRASAATLQRDAQHLGFVTSPNDPRASIAACPGAPACASGHIAARDIAATIAAEHGDLLDGSLTLHISGCAKGCAHPARAALTMVGSEDGAGLVVAGTARKAPLASTAAGNVPAGFSRVAALIRGERSPVETVAGCVARLDDTRIVTAFAAALAEHDAGRP